MEAIKNLCSYLFLGRCRKHDCDLTVVRVEGYFASTAPVCIECHPHYRSLAPLAPISRPAPETREVEVG